MAKAIVVIGRTKSGKTTTVKSLLNETRLNRAVYDVNNEYNTGRPLVDMVEFLNTATKLTDSYIVFEEATIFFSNRGDERQLKEILVRKRHTRNIVILCFHSLRAVPTYVFDLSDFYILHKTNDNESLVWKKFNGNDALLEDFLAVRDNENPHFKVIRRIN